ncbi:MAG: glycosyltransferase family 4 protein [Desulfuromonadales bacterium]
MQKQAINNKAICYVLNSFPNPSETFISGEAASMLDFGIIPYILALKPGDMSVVHPSARKLMDAGLVTIKQEFSKIESLYSLLKLLLFRPRIAFKCFFKALFSGDRWLYFQTVPYALELLNRKTRFIHAHFADWNFHWASVLSAWTGIPYGVTTHRYDLLDDPIPAAIVTNLLTNADLVVTISDFNRQYMANKYELSLEGIKIVRCGVDLTKFVRNEKFTNLKNKKINLINIGRLVPAKGHDILIKALSKARCMGVEFDLTIIGAGPLRETLSVLSRSLNLDDCIHFIGAQPQDVVIELLKKSDAFVLSSRSEGLPVVCMEAMAMGTLLIASHINGIPELVEDKVNGLLVESENIDALANAICWVDQNRDRLESMCDSARVKVEQEFDRIKCTRRLLSYMFAD